MQRNSMEPLQAERSLKRIEQTTSVAQHGRAVFAAGAESHEYRVAPLYLVVSALQDDAVDDACTQARNQGVSVTIFQLAQHPVWATPPLGGAGPATCSTTPLSKTVPPKVRCSAACAREAPTGSSAFANEGPGHRPLPSKTDCSNPSLAFTTRPTPTFLEWAWASGVGTHRGQNATAAHLVGGKVQWARVLNSDLVLPASASDSSTRCGYMPKPVVV